MGLLTKPADLSASDALTSTIWNNLKNALYDAIGTVAAGVGTLDYTNLATNAAIRASQILYTAATLTDTAVQTFTGPIKFTEPRLTAPSNVGTLANAAAGNVNLISNKLFQKTGGTGTITTMTPGSNHVEGSRIYLVCVHSLTITDTATDTLNSIHLKTTSAGTPTPVATATDPTIYEFLYTKMDGLFSNLQWIEL